MDFVAAFKARVKAIDNPEVVFKVTEEPTQEPVEYKRFDIHKRTLPGLASRKVAFNVSEEEAKVLLSSTHLVRTQEGYDAIDTKVSLLANGVQPDGKLIFYDVIPTDATLEEQDPLYNDSKIILEEPLL